MSRRSIKDKQKENKSLRTLMLSILKKPDIRLLSLGPLSPELLEAFYEAYHLDSFIARRRLERHIVNLMREADEEIIEFLHRRLEHPEQFLAERQARIDAQREELLSDPKSLANFIATYPDVPVQKLRQLLRAAKNPKKEKELNQLLQDVLGL